MSMPTDLPPVPLEVAENVIDQLSRDVRSLCSCALTCRGWHPRARYHLFAFMCIRSLEDLYIIGNYFRTNPRMATFIRGLSISPVLWEPQPQSLLETLPVDLLSRLPNLRSYGMKHGVSFRSCTMRQPEIGVSFHTNTLIHMRTYLHVEELTLGPMILDTEAELARLILALPRLRRLRCTGLRVLDQENGQPYAGITRFRDKCSQLSEVTVWNTAAGAVRLTIHMSLSALKILRWQSPWSDWGDGAPSLNWFKWSDLKRLHSLELTTGDSWDKRPFHGIIEHIAITIPNKLGDLMMVFTESSPFTPALPEGDIEADKTLDDAIVTLGVSRVVVCIQKAKRNRLAIWSKIIQSRLPRLYERRLLHVQCSSDGEVNLGHDAVVTAIATSPDSRYVATGASDGSVIVWRGLAYPQSSVVELQCGDASNVMSLTFSDVGELLGATQGPVVHIWRVIDGSLVTSTLIHCRQSYCVWKRDSPHHLNLSGLGSEPEESYRISVANIPLQLQKDPVDGAGQYVPSSPEYVDLQGSSYHLLMARSSSGRWVAATSIISALVCNLELWRLVESAPAYTGPHRLTERSATLSWPSCATFMGDEQLFVGFNDGTVRWWDVSSFPLATTQPRGALTVPSKCSEVTTVVVSPSASFLVVLFHSDTTVPVLVRTSHSTPPDNRGEVFSADHTFLGSRVSPRSVEAVCISPCERYIASAYGDTTVRLWSSGDGSLIWTFTDHDAAVTHIAFSPDGRILVSADKVGKVCVHVLSRFVRGMIRATTLHGSSTC